MAPVNDHAKILTCWRATELFSAQSVPAADPRHREQPVFRVLASEPLPWQSNHALQQSPPPLKKVWRHFVYGGLFRSDISRELLEKHFGANDDAFDRPDDAAYCLFAFEVDEGGQPLPATYALSSLAWALGRTLSPGPNDPTWLTGFGKAENDAKDDFVHRCAFREENPESSEPSKENLESNEDETAVVDTTLSTHEEKSKDSFKTEDRPLKHDDLINEINGCIESLGVGPLIIKPMARVRSLLVNERRDDTENEPMLLNSFFINDLDKVEKINQGRHSQIT